jgi:hypothetical protein
MGGTGNATTFGRVGALLAIFSCGALVAACGEVTANGAEETRLCGEMSCAGKDCPPPRQAKDETDAGARCVTGNGGATGAGSGSAPGGSAGTGGGVPMQVAEFSCTVCRKAENCCKAEGLTDCGYTAACASSTNAQEMQFYVVLCRAVLSASTAGSKVPANACGF